MRKGPSKQVTTILPRLLLTISDLVRRGELAKEVVAMRKRLNLFSLCLGATNNRQRATAVQQLDNGNNVAAGRDEKISLIRHR